MEENTKINEKTINNQQKTSKNNVILEIKGVDKLYKLGNKNTFQALTNINTTFHKGELVSIIGESGSGKSTLMNLIGGLDSDFTGAIIADGQNLKDLSDKELDKYRKNKVGFVFQSFNLIPHLTILDNVTIALTLSNEKESVKVEKATKLLTRLGLEKQLKKKPTQLSGGQKQRVAIARALINDPDIILADEPTGALDSGTTMQILEILKEIADEGKLVIMVTHSEKVASISSRIVEISDGKIVRDEVIKDYKKSTNKILKEQETQKTDKVSSKSTKQNLSLWSALRLSLHNMWASKTKNLLMAFGVSISILAMIIMLAFGSGLTDYINNLAAAYSNPTIVTISKSPEKKENGSFDPSQMIAQFIPPTFDMERTEENGYKNEVDSLVDELNGKLANSKNFKDFQIYQEDTDEHEKNLTYGFTTVFSSFNKDMIAEWIYTPDVEDDETTPEIDESEPIKEDIFFLYTTPGYYTNSNLVSTSDEAHISGTDEVMFSLSFAQALGLDANEVVGKQVEIHVKMDGIEITKNVTVSAIVNVQMFEGMMVMYVDYDFLNSLVESASLEQKGETISLPVNYVYIQTNNEKITDYINDYLKNDPEHRFNGSIEEQLAGMFNGMLSTFSIALAVIAGISLVVAAIMILVVLYMSVTERTREIGVLKSIGARRKDIKRIFSSESFLIGLLSGIVGIILSLVFYLLLFVIFKSLLGVAPISLRWWYFVGALGVSLLISVLSGLYPAAKAAKLDPVESLRHE